MPPDTQALLITLVTQAVLTGTLGGLLLAFHRTYRQAFLRDWAVSWWAAALSILAGLASTTEIWSVPPAASTRLLFSILSQWTAYLRIIYLITGASEKALIVPVSQNRRRGLALLALLAALAIALPFADDPLGGSARLLLRVGLRNVATGIAFLAVAVLLGRRRELATVGRRFLVGTMALYAMGQFLYAYYSIANIMGWPVPQAVAYHGNLDIVLQALIGFSMVSALLEGERERAEDRAREAQAAGEALRAQDVRFRMLIENANDIITILESDGRVSYVSPPLTRILGWMPSEWMGRFATEFVHRDDSVRFSETQREVMAMPEEIRQATFRLRHRDGSYRLLEGIGRGMREHDGRTVILINSRDITDRVRAEAAHRTTEEQLALHLAQTPLGVIEFDLDTRIREWNPAAATIFGWTRSEVVGRGMELLVPEESQPESRRELRAILAGSGVARATAINRRKDGRLIECEWTNTLLKDASGRAIGVACFVQDITERRRLEQHLARAQRLDSVGRLAAGVAHDFNNLLTAIFGGVEAIRGGLRVGEPVDDDLAAIDHAARRAAALTRQLLAFARQQVVVARTVDLDQLLDSLVQMLRRVLGAQVELMTTTAAEHGLAHIDAGQLEQVILNLVVNARDAMPAGGQIVLETGRRRVEHLEVHEGETVEPGEYVTLTVRDNGSGIAPEVRPHIFEPFFTTKGPGQGTGLGLATSYGIVRQHGGHLWCASELGVGTAFTICLPRAAAAAATAPAPAPDDPASAGNATILIAEDDPTVRSTTARVLRKQGYTVLEAQDGQHAFELIERTVARVDLVLTDLVMPRLGGLALATLMRAEFPEILVCFTSGYSEEVESIEELTEAGLFLRKPFDPDELLRFVGRVLKAHRASSTSNSWNPA